MSTLNGFGTLFYGWKHFPEQASTATKWLAAFYIPVVPLGRYQLRVHTSFGNDRTQVRATPIGLVASQHKYFEILGKTPLSWHEVLLTYASAFIGLPLLMFAPILAIWLLHYLGWTAHYKTQEEMPMWLTIVFAIMTAAQLVCVLYWPIWAIRKSRGMQTRSSLRFKTKGNSVDRRSVEHHL